MLQTKIPTVRPRPTKLSDPFWDFTEELLEELLNTPDNEMNWRHYQNFLGPHLPAGTYDEVVYFLPRAFDYMVACIMKAHDFDWENYQPPNNEILEYVPRAIVGFCSHHAEELQSDGILPHVREAIRECLRLWITKFEVVHRPLPESGVRYFDYVIQSEDVNDFVENLIEFKRHGDLVVEFLEELANHEGNTTRAAWFLEIARSRRSDTVYTYTQHYAPAASLMFNRELIESAASMVRNMPTPSPTYWPDTFKTLDTGNGTP